MAKNKLIENENEAFHIRSEGGLQGSVSYTSLSDAKLAVKRAQYREDNQGEGYRWFVASSVENDPARKGWREVVEG